MLNELKPMNGTLEKYNENVLSNTFDQKIVELPHAPRPEHVVRREADVHRLLHCLQPRQHDRRAERPAG